MSDSENSDGEEELVAEFRVLLQTALESAETLMQFLEQEDNTSFSEIILPRKIRMNIRKKKNAEIVSKVRHENSFPKQPLCLCASSSLGCEVFVRTHEQTIAS